MIENNIIASTLILLLLINLFGFLYSYLIIKTNLFKRFKLQNRPHKLKNFYDRMPLICFNLVILILPKTSCTVFNLLFKISSLSFPNFTWALLFAKYNIKENIKETKIIIEEILKLKNNKKNNIPKKVIASKRIFERFNSAIVRWVVSTVMLFIIFEEFT